MIDELLAPLAPEEPTDAEIRQLLARADRRTKRRRVRVASTAAVAAVGALAALAALPSDPNAPPARQSPLSASALLSTAAAVAAEQPGPADWAGFRYVQQVELRTYPHYTVESIDESWTSSDWMGRRITTGAHLVDGHLPTPEEQRADLRQAIDRLPEAQRARARKNLAKAKFSDQSRVLADNRFDAPADMPNLYGDGPLAKAPLNELPADPARLGALLIDAHRDGRWTPGGSWQPLESDVKYDVLRDILLLLTEANTTPAQRAALITVLRNYEGVTPLEAAKDHRGRVGNGVEIPTGRATVRVLFTPETSELLEWSEPGEVHTYLHFDHVAQLP